MRILNKLSILIIAVIFSSCSFVSESSGELYAMDTYMTINAYGKNSDAVIKSAEDEINRLDSLLSIHKKSSEVYKINNDKKATVSKETLELINRALEINKITDGSFDITTEPLSRAYGFYSGLTHRVPTKEEISDILEYVGSDNVLIDGETIALSSNSCIDLGGIAKGYTAFALTMLFNDNNISSAMFSLGGNVRVIGSKPDGSKWSVAIADPNDVYQNIGTLKVTDTSVVTSGAYQQNFERQGKVYHHIIDPNTGYPADSGLKSVTIVSEDDILADALSTALYVMGLEKSTEFYRNYSDKFGAVLVTDDDIIYITENIKNDFVTDSDIEVIHS